MAWTISGDYYVDGISGDDANAGTSTAPFKTIPAAIAAAEAAGSGYQDIVVGAGTYTDRLVAGSSTDYLCLKADGQVIFDCSNLIDTAFYDGYKWKVVGFNIINATAGIIGGSNSQRVPKFYDCYFKNCEWYIGNNYINSGYYVFKDCIFDHVKTTGAVGSFYARYWTFQNCIFFNCTMPNYSEAGGQYSSNSYAPDLTSCLIDCDTPTLTAYYRSNISQTVRNTIFTPRTRCRDKDAGYASGSAWQDVLDANLPGKFFGCKVMSASFNDIVSGSNYLTDAIYTLSATANNSALFKDPIPGQIFGTEKLATAYGYDDSTSNPLHIAGGATWTNITSSIAGGLQISASTHPTGTIESAIIDQGSPKLVREIKTSWSSTEPGATGISVYTASVANQYPTRQTYEMRYGNNPDLSSNIYKIFDLGSPIYVDSNGSGSGDINFITGSNVNVTARYLQLKYTLRTNFTGSL